MTPIKCAYCRTEYTRYPKPERGRDSEFVLSESDYIECCGCYLWRWSTCAGYACAHINGKSTVVNRWQLGLEIGNPKVICHSCRNRNCVKRAHIRADTYQSNEHDKIADGTSNRGAQNGRAKLTREQAYHIKYLDTGTNIATALHYGVTEQTIWRIRNGITWKDL